MYFKPEGKKIIRAQQSTVIYVTVSFTLSRLAKYGGMYSSQYRMHSSSNIIAEEPNCSKRALPSTSRFTSNSLKCVNSRSSLAYKGSSAFQMIST